MRLGSRPLTDPSISRTVRQMKAQGKSIRTIADAAKVSKSFIHKTCKHSCPETLEIPPAKTRRLVPPNLMIKGNQNVHIGLVALR